MTEQFQSSKFLIAAGPVNWYEPHAKAVAERNAQLDKAQAEKTANLKQKLQVLKEEDPILKLAALSKTVQSAAKLTSAVAKKVKAEKDKEKKERETKANDLNFRWNIGDERAQALAQSAVGYDGPRDKVFTTENKKFRKLLEPDGLLHGPEYAGYVDEVRTLGARMQTQLLESYTIRESHRLADISSYENSKEWKEKYASGIEGALTPDDWNNKVKTPQGLLEHKSWWYDRIKAMGHSDELTKKYMGSELTRALSTKKNIDLASTKFRIDKKNVAIADGFYLTKANTTDSSDIPRLYVDRINQVAEGLEDITENGKVIETATQQAVKIVDAEFAKINGTGYVPQLAVQDFENYRFKHPAGKGGYANIREAFFGGEDSFLVKIMQDNERGQKRYLAVQSTLANQYAAELLTMGGTGKMSKQDFDVAVLNLKGGGHLSAQTLTALERVNPEVQSTSITESEQLKLDALVSTGRTSKFDGEIAGFTQNSIIEEGKAVKQQLSKFRSDMELDKTSSEAGNNSDGWALGQVDTVLGLNLPPLSHLKAGTQRTAQRIISQIRDEEIGKQFKIAKEGNTLNDKTHASTIIVNVNRRLEELGINKTYGQPGSGPLSKHQTDQSFPGLETYHEAIVEAGKESRIGSDWPVVEQEGVAIRDHIMKSDIPSALNKKGLIVKNLEFLALSKSIDPSGRITSWPPDLILKAEMIGVAPGVIAARQLEALLSSTDQGDIDYVKLHQLDNLTSILDAYDQADIRYRQLLTDINDPYLPPGMNISRITNTQFQRLMQYEKQIAETKSSINYHSWRNPPKFGTKPTIDLEPQIDFNNQEDSPNIEFNTNTN